MDFQYNQILEKAKNLDNALRLSIMRFLSVVASNKIYDSLMISKQNN